MVVRMCRFSKYVIRADIILWNIITKLKGCVLLVKTEMKVLPNIHSTIICFGLKKHFYPHLMKQLLDNMRSDFVFFGLTLWLPISYSVDTNISRSWNKWFLYLFIKSFLIVSMNSTRFWNLILSLNNVSYASQWICLWWTRFTRYRWNCFDESIASDFNATRLQPLALVNLLFPGVGTILAWDRRRFYFPRAFGPHRGNRCVQTCLNAKPSATMFWFPGRSGSYGTEMSSWRTIETLIVMQDNEEQAESLSKNYSESLPLTFR